MVQKIKLGMVGGGQGAFIGAVHRIASRIDDRYELVAGAFSSDAERALASGKELVSLRIVIIKIFKRWLKKRVLEKIKSMLLLL